VPIVSTIACDTGAFDRAEASLSEAFLRSDSTGTVVYIGSSREGWGIPGTWLGPSFQYSYEFYRQFLTGQTQIAGEVFAEMKSGFDWKSAYEGATRWLQFAINFQGDPLVQMYRDDPVMLAPAFEAEITEGDQTYDVSGIPAGARVVLWQDADVYIVGSADQAGTFSADISPQSGAMQVTVIAPDAAVFTGEVTVVEPQADLPYVVDGATVVFFGTAGDDVFAFAAGQVRHTVTLNGTVWTFDAADITRIEFQGNGGADRADLAGTSGADIAILRSGRAVLTGPGYAVGVTGAVQVSLAGGENDQAYLHGTAGDDQLDAGPHTVTMTGESYDYAVTGFGYVHATAGAGGLDTGLFHDSAGDDTLLTTPTYVMLTGAGFTNVGSGFQDIMTLAQAGGYDTADMYDSAGDDVFVATPTDAYLQGAGFISRVTGFDRVTGHATAGGYDTAWLYDSAGNDRYTSTETTARLAGAGFVNVANGFDSVTPTLRWGLDTAEVFHSASGSHFGGNEVHADLTGGHSGSGHISPAVPAEAAEGGTAAATLDYAVAAAATDQVGGQASTATTVRTDVRGPDPADHSQGEHDRTEADAADDGLTPADDASEPGRAPARSARRPVEENSGAAGSAGVLVNADISAWVDVTFGWDLSASEGGPAA